MLFEDKIKNDLKRKWLMMESLVKEEVDISSLEKIQFAIEKGGGELFVVGGPIRDTLLNHSPKDIDFMVRKIEFEEIVNIINNIGEAKEVGKSFGIVKGVIDGEEFDFAIPRIGEKKTGDLHTDFDVTLDKDADLKDDLGRRDFTWNSMALPISIFIKSKKSSNPAELVKQFLSDPKNKEKYDPFDGMKDLENKQLNSVGDPYDRFKEDPLRILRAIQFSSRFGFRITGETLESMKKLKHKLTNISKERIGAEFRKAWTKGISDTKVTIELLKETGIGEELFGKDFNPIIVKKTKNSNESILSQFTAYFLLGGNYEKMDPTNEMVKLLKVAKSIRENKDYPNFNLLSTAKKNNWFPVLKIVFESTPVMKIINKIEEEETPLSITDLIITGDDILTLLKRNENIPKSKIGPMTGKIIEEILKGIWLGKIENNKNSLELFIIDFMESNNGQKT